MATGLLTTRLAVPVMPSRFVAGKDSTWAMPVALKNEGKVLTENCGVAAEEVAAVKRVARRVTVSAVEEAMVVPCPAVNAVTCAVTVCPRCKAEVFV